MDNGATTQVCPEAIAAAEEGLRAFGNPSSLHRLGGDAKLTLNQSRKKMERLLGAEEGTFFFTSGATEANNWAILATAERNTKFGRHLITSKTEHPSVLEPMRHLEAKGFEVDYIGVDASGILDVAELYNKLRPDTVLVSIMSVNNETGVRNDVAAIGRNIKQRNPDTIFHVDGVASCCKIPLRLQGSGIDLFSMSGHKIHAPKGIGGLYIRRNLRIAPLIFGGGQQKNLRSGTESTVLIQSMAAAAEVGGKNIKENAAQVWRLKERFIAGLDSCPGAQINGAVGREESSAYVLNVGFPGCKAQVLLNALEERGIYVSAGSACSSNKLGAAGVLQAMGIEAPVAEGALRFSFSRFTTEQEIDDCLTALADVLKRYRV